MDLPVFTSLSSASKAPGPSWQPGNSQAGSGGAAALLKIWRVGMTGNEPDFGGPAVPGTPTGADGRGRRGGPRVQAFAAGGRSRHRAPAATCRDATGGLELPGPAHVAPKGKACVLQRAQGAFISMCKREARKGLDDGRLEKLICASSVSLFYFSLLLATTVLPPNPKGEDNFVGINEYRLASSV